MRFTRITPAPSFIILFIACVCLFGAGAHAHLHAQEAPQEKQLRLEPSLEAARRIEAYERGDFEGAVKSLKQATQQHQDDATSWHFLGLAYKQLGKQKDARKAVERAVYTRLFTLGRGAPQKTIKPWDELSKEARAERRREIAGRYKEALASIEIYLQLDPEPADFWRQQYESLSFHVKNEETPDAEKEVFQGNDEAISKAKIHHKSEPTYTEKARQNQINGTVILRGLLASDGKVKHVIALVMLPGGLTENAMDVMRKIKFTPATKDGRPVSQWVTVEYNFNTR